MSTPLRFGPARGVPSTSTAPASGARKPAMMFMSVVLPQPDGPTIATNSPSRTSKSRPSMTDSRPLSVANPLLTPWTWILVRITPPHALHVLEQPHGAVEREPDQADDDHAGDHEVVAVTGIARIHDHVTETRAQRDHLRRHHHEPRDTEADAHADDDLRQRRGEHHLPEQLRARHAEILRGAQVALLDGVHARRRLHDHREHRRDEDQVDRRGVADAEPQD